MRLEMPQETTEWGCSSEDDIQLRVRVRVFSCGYDETQLTLKSVSVFIPSSRTTVSEKEGLLLRVSTGDSNPEPFGKVAVTIPFRPIQEETQIQHRWLGVKKQLNNEEKRARYSKT